MQFIRIRKVPKKILKMVTGLTLYWQFSEFGDNIVYDSSGRGNDGTIQQGGVLSKFTLVPGVPISDEDEWGEKVKPCRSLNGTICSQILSELERNMTIEFHARRTQSSGVSVDLCSLSENLHVFIKPESGTCNLSVDMEIYQTSKRVVLNQWMHYAIVICESKLDLFIDGISVLTNISSNPINGALKVGNLFGDITEVRVWSVARSIAELKEYMYCPLMRALPASSKWKGLRIKSVANSRRSSAVDSLPSVPELSVAIESLPRLNLKRVQLETHTPHEPIEHTPRVAQNAGLEDVPGSPESPPKNVNVSVESEESVHPEEHTKIIYPPTPLLDSRVQLSTAIEFHDDYLQSIIVTPPTPAPDSRVEVSTAIEFYDDRLQSIMDDITNDNIASLHDKLFAVIRSILQFINANYRVGPYISPIPDILLMDQLRFACKYLPVALLLQTTNKTALTRIFRIPMLRVHLIKFLLLDPNMKTILLKEFGNDLNADQIQQLRTNTTTSNTVESCPLCKAPFQNPLQDTCQTGCKVKFTICFLTASLTDISDCVKCTFCHSVVSDTHSKRNIHGVPTSKVTFARSSCPICKCSRSLVPA